MRTPFLPIGVSAAFFFLVAGEHIKEINNSNHFFELLSLRFKILSSFLYKDVGVSVQACAGIPGSATGARNHWAPFDGPNTGFDIKACSADQRELK
jgi:hypothetical protein